MSFERKTEERASDQQERPKFSHVTSFDEVFSESGKKGAVDEVRTYRSGTITFTLQGKLDSIIQVLRLFKKSEARVTSVDCLVDGNQYKVHFDSDSAKVVEKLVGDVREAVENSDLVKLHLDELSSFNLPWFPKNLSDLDKSAKNVLMYGSELDADHPGFTDAEYRKRRKIFTDIALSYSHGDPIPRIQYTEEEVQTWGKVYKELTSLYPLHACKTHVMNLPLLSLNCGYSRETVPQLEDVSRFLQQKTGFRLRPVAGFLSPRDFLAGLAFRVFNCTQYIRHSSDPFYTPEPDLCHELLGHVPLLADPEFAQFNQEIGLASLGASDEDISKLAACYLYTVEFGLCQENGDVRAFGAGLLSSPAELKHALSSPEKIRTFDPDEASRQEFYVTTYQPTYFVSQSVEEAKSKMRHFVKSIKRPFQVEFQPLTCSVRLKSNEADRDQ